MDDLTKVLIPGFLMIVFSQTQIDLDSGLFYKETILKTTYKTCAKLRTR